MYIRSVRAHFTLAPDNDTSENTRTRKHIHTHVQQAQ